MITTTGGLDTRINIQQIIENSKVNYPKGISVEPTPKTEIKNTKSKTRVTPY